MFFEGSSKNHSTFKKILLLQPWLLKRPLTTVGLNYSENFTLQTHQLIYCLFYIPKFKLCNIKCPINLNINHIKLAGHILILHSLYS